MRAYTHLSACRTNLYRRETKKGDVEANGFNNCPDKNTD